MVTHSNPVGEPLDGRYQALIDRIEARGGRGQVPPKAPPKIEAGPALAERQREREKFSDTVASSPELAPNDDDDAWREPDKRSSIALVLATLSGGAVAVGLGWAVYLMTRVG
jgi:hypothetical protein